ncbi:hypothetical protein ACLX1H_002517 [Fusarium chlamydosporum]
MNSPRIPSSSVKILGPPLPLEGRILHPTSGNLAKYTIIWLLDRKEIPWRLEQFVTDIISEGPEKLVERKDIRHRLPFGCGINVTWQNAQWWSFRRLLAIGNEEWNEVTYAVSRLDATIEKEAAVIGRENIILVGFGEGCAVGLMYLLEANQPLGAFCGYQGYIPLEKDVLFIEEFGTHPQITFSSMEI